MKKLVLLKYISIACLLLLITNITHAKNYYISTSGNDTNNGLTSATAWNSIAKLNASFNDIQAGDSILFKCDEIFYGTITIGKSGTKTSPIVFSSYGSGAKPIITGFTVLTNWTRHEGNIWKTNIAEAGNKMLLVSINNKLQRMGRHPNFSPTTGGYLSYETTSTAPSITDNQLPATPNWTGAEAVIKKYSYVIDVCPITDHTGGKLTYSYAINNRGQSSSLLGKNGYGYFIQNDIRTLDQFGEWYFNKLTKDLYVYFGSNDPSTYVVKASTLNILFNCGGGGWTEPSTTARTGIVLKKLALEGASKYAYYTFNGADMTVKDCTFNNNFGAIYMWNVPNSLSDNNIVTNTLNNGIEQMGRVSSPTVITNNTVKICGMFEGMGGSGGASYQGISQNGDYSTIEKNVVDSVGYIGIAFYGANVLVKHNYIKNYCAILDDGGGIYTFHEKDRMNRVVESNIIINGGGGRRGRPENADMTHGLYTDGASRYVTLKNNTVSQTDGSGYLMNTGNDIVLTGNTFYNVPKAISISRFHSPNEPTCRNNKVESNICFPTLHNYFYWNGQLNYPVTIDIMTDMRLVGTFDKNFYRNDLTAPFDYYYHMGSGGAFVDPPSLNFSQWQTYMNDEKNSQILSPSENIFKYNATSTPVVFNFDGQSKKDVHGVTYHNSYTIPAFSSVILWDAALVMPPSIGTITHPGCNTTGSVVINGLPAVGAWTLTRMPGGIKTTGTGPSTTITGLSGGTYYFTVTDETSGNTSVPSSNAVVNAQPLIPFAPIVVEITQPTCKVATGSVEFTGLPGGIWTLTRTPGEVTTTGSGTWKVVTDLPAGSYTYTLTNAGGCVSAASANVVINQQPQSVTPIITQKGMTLSSDATTGNQWYNENGLIVGANLQQYTATSDGNYYVIVSSGGCISNPSNTIKLLNTSSGFEEIQQSTILVYPNPMTNVLSIEIKGNTKKKGFEIINSTGQVVFKGFIVEKKVVQTADFPSGIYMIKIESGNTFELKSTIKI
ncbi:MAG TPA: right-handed parallel beta-helix repeat-containing protein [Prolixibacteraceae bacterium]|nr:right-handed parallel beta-helix repeat-containing protein [Prolixibacteraceae bacterium]